MNILIVISSLAFGGAEKQAVIDANILANKHKVMLIAFHDGELKELVQKNVELIILKKVSYLKTALKLTKIVEDNKIEIIHAHLYAPMVISAISTIIDRKVKIIWNFHSHSFNDPLKGKLGQKYSAKLPGVKKIIFPSKVLYEYFISNGYAFPKDKCMVMYNSGGLQLSRNIEKENSKLIIGYVGRLVELKRVEILISTAKFLREHGIEEFEFWILGDGDQKEKLKSEIINLNLSKYIKFWGFQSDTGKYYYQFDIFVLPSREEVLSLSLIDAGLNGRAAVAFNVGGNAEVIKDGITGYIVETKAEFNDKVLQLALNEKLRISLGKAASENCIKVFSNDTRLRNLESLYKEVIT